MNQADRDASWQDWTFGKFVKETEAVLREVGFPTNASFSPVALHFYHEGILLDLRYRNHVYATTWLSEHEDLQALHEWAVKETRQFAEHRKAQKRHLTKIRGRS